jgi:hypothetical protein
MQTGATRATPEPAEPTSSAGLGNLTAGGMQSSASDQVLQERAVRYFAASSRRRSNRAVVSRNRSTSRVSSAT